MQVVSKTMTGCGVLIAVLMIAGGGLAQANLVGEAGGQALAEAESNYHADASGAVDAANAQQAQVRDQAAEHVRNASTVQDTYADASAQTDVDVEQPTCESCRDAVAQLEEEGAGNLATAHEAEQAAGVDNEYVDAGADARAAGQAQAWYHELFNGVTDAFDKVHSMLDQDVEAHEQASAQVDQSLDGEAQAREGIASTLESEEELAAPVEPSLEGGLGGQHATSAATSMVTEAGSS